MLAQDMMISLLNGEETNIPETLVQNETIFKSVINFDVWELFSAKEKEHLLKFIPSIIQQHDGYTNSDFKEDTVKAILSNDQGFKYGNPVQILFEKLKAGLLSPSGVKLRNKCWKLKMKNYKLKQKEYYKNLLQEIIITRQAILEKGNCNGSSFNTQKRKPIIINDNLQNIDEKVKRKYEKIVKDVSAECLDDVLSSDEEPGFSSKSSDATAYKNTKAESAESLSPKLPSGISNDTIPPDNLHHMLDHHRRKRLLCEIHAELDTTNISLADVIMRCNSIKKAGKGKKKIKKKKGKGKKKVCPIKNIDIKETIKDNLKQDSPKEITKISKPQVKVVEQISPEKKELPKTPILSKDIQYYPKMESFFSLLGHFFQQEQEKVCRLQTIEEKLNLWQNHKSSDLCGWKTLYPNWWPITAYAISYMTGEGTSSLLQGFVPLLNSLNEEEWKWTGPDYSNDAVITPLCNHWLDTLSEIITAEKNIDDKDRKTLDTSRTAYIVSLSNPGDKAEFREQEKERYANPHRPFIYTTHGYQSIVGPVKGVFTSINLSSSKAREHAMLVSERPAYVTILCLVRDAVARLPNGEGTRTDVCTLLKDSQFLNPDASDSQVNGVVSGALDRLHAEKDPCVKFDPIRKLWIYLHRSRSMEEFEKLHEASAAAALAKKQLTQSKQKITKHKKPAPEVTESVQEKCKVKKEISMKVKKPLPVKSVDEIPLKHVTNEVPNTVIPKPIVEAGDDTKKKAIKRKKSTNESLGSKFPKIHDFERSRNDIIDELQLSLENEALMATQSILSDDEASDIFGDKRGHSDFLDIDAFTTPSDDLPSPCPVSTSFELESALSNVSDSSFGIDILQGACNENNDNQNSNLETFIEFQTAEHLKPTIEVENLPGNHTELLRPQVLDKPPDFSLQNASLRPNIQKQVSLSQLSDMLGDKPVVNYATGETIMLSSLNTSSPGSSASSQLLPVNEPPLISSNTLMCLQSKQQTLPTHGNTQLQHKLQSQHYSQLQPIHNETQQFIQTQQTLTTAPDYVDDKKDFMKQQVQMQQLKIQQLIQRKHLQQQSQMTEQSHVTKQTVRKDAKDASNRHRNLQGKVKNYQQHSLPQNLQLPSGMKLQPQLAATKPKYVQPQLGLNFGNMIGSSVPVQALSQFITSKSPQSSKPNIIPVVTSTLSLPSSTISTITFIPSTAVSSRLTTTNLNPSTISVGCNPHQLQQQYSKSNTTGIEESDSTRTISFQSFTSNQGNPGHFRVHGSSNSTIPPANQFVDVKGCAGNQIITGQPPSSLINQKSNIIQQAITVSTGSPVQTFSLNQLMAVARVHGPDNSASTGQKVHTVPIPVSQVMRTSNPGITSPVTSIQALLQVVPKLGNNTQFLIQRQLPGNLDPNISKVVRLPKTFCHPNLASGSRPIQNSTLTFQKVDNPAGHIFGQHALATGQKSFQKTNSPNVAPLKISLPRANFTGLPPSISVSSPGQSLRFSSIDGQSVRFSSNDGQCVRFSSSDISSTNMRLPLPASKITSPTVSNYLNPDYVNKAPNERP